jgi:threonylcarbamoyladenosine tRNA methylthiotransferase MtaB
VKKVVIETLGCKLNQAESEELADKLAAAGCRIVTAVDEADVYILNTCAVTATADSKTRHLLRMAHRRSPRAVVVAVGCCAQRDRRQLEAIDGVSLVLDNTEKANLADRLREGGWLDGAASLDADYGGLRCRSFVRAQQGCSNFCAYCIVPLVRGGEKSLPRDEVIAAINERAGRGYREVVLTGTEIGSYRHDGVDIKGLIEAVLGRTNIERLRLSSLQPHHITPPLVEMWRNPRLCPHFHLSLQSGSDGVLARMGRRYKAQDYQRAVSLIRSIVPEAAVTTDVIAGFPGESEVEFEESYEF